jgi:hypothetical protein
VGWQGYTLKGHQAEVNSVAISPDGKHVISGSDDQLVKIWEVDTGAEVHNPGAVWQVCWQGVRGCARVGRGDLVRGATDADGWVFAGMVVYLSQLRGWLHLHLAVFDPLGGQKHRCEPGVPSDGALRQGYPGTPLTTHPKL